MGERLVALSALVGLVAAACMPSTGPGIGRDGGTFRSNGERIYFTATSERDTQIDYTGGPQTGGMMMSGRFSCASCHGVDARGGRHTMQMQMMDAPDIRWMALGGHGEDAEGGGEHAENDEYAFEQFALAVSDGLHPDGERLSDDMPRWDIPEADLRDLAEYLQSFPEP